MPLWHLRRARPLACIRRRRRARSSGPAHGDCCAAVAGSPGPHAGEDHGDTPCESRGIGPGRARIDSERKVHADQVSIALWGPYSDGV